MGRSTYHKGSRTFLRLRGWWQRPSKRSKMGHTNTPPWPAGKTFETGSVATLQATLRQEDMMAFRRKLPFLEDAYACKG